MSQQGRRRTYPSVLLHFLARLCAWVSDAFLSSPRGAHMGGVSRRVFSPSCSEGGPLCSIFWCSAETVGTKKEKEKEVQDNFMTCCCRPFGSLRKDGVERGDNYVTMKHGQNAERN